jgi:type VI secretion system secreted protein Hcp
MRRKILWITAALVLIALPAVVGLVALREDSSSTDRRAGALVAPGSTAVAAQLQLTSQPGMGEIKDVIVVNDFSLGVENPTTIGSATGGAGAGKAKFNEFQIKKTTDNASPVLFKNLAAGAHYKKAVLTVRKPGSAKPYMTYTFETVFTTKIDWSGPGDEGPEESISFVYGKLVVQSDGTNADGKTATVTSGWNQVLNKSDDVVTP